MFNTFLSHLYGQNKKFNQFPILFNFFPNNILLHICATQQSKFPFADVQKHFLQGWTPRPAGNPPRGEGGVPRPAPRCSALPRKNDQNCGEVAGQNKGPNLNFLQYRKQMMEQYYNTEQGPIQPLNRICKRK